VIISEFLKYYQKLILGLKEGGKEKKENDTLVQLSRLSFLYFDRTGREICPFGVF